MPEWGEEYLATVRDRLRADITNTLREHGAIDLLDDLGEDGVESMIGALVADAMHPIEKLIAAGMTLAEAQQWLRDHVDEGAECPCCTQFAKVYKRKMTSVAARTMIAMRRADEWSHIPTLLRRQLPEIAHQGGYATLGQHWGLIEESPEEREDGGRVGWWRLTERGEQFVSNLVAVPKYARLYDGKCLGLMGDPVRIVDALGDRFDYQELMSA